MVALIAANDLVKAFTASRRLRDVLRGHRPMLRAVNGVSLSVAAGRALGIVGESGCGKTTTARLLLRLEEPTSGAVIFEGQDVTALHGQGWLPFRSRVPLVFQNPFDALNPRFTIRRSLREPLHGCALASMLGIGQVLVPPAPGVLCAQGLLSADMRAEFSRSVLPSLAQDQAEDPAWVEAGFAELESEAAAWFTEDAVAPEARSTARVVLMRYAGQGSELPVPWRGASAAADFAATHRALYGFDLPQGRAEIVTRRLEAAGALPPATTATLPPGRGAMAFGTQAVHFESGTAAAALYERAALGQGDRFAGPVIVTQRDATTLVPPGWTAAVLAQGAILLRHG